MKITSSEVIILLTQQELQLLKIACTIACSLGIKADYESVLKNELQSELSKYISSPAKYYDMLSLCEKICAAE